MIYKELYDQMLDECSETCPTCSSYGASRILEEMDPIAYRCGFADWTDSLRDCPPQCTTCKERDVTDFDVCIEDDVECEVCKDNAFVCYECDEACSIEDNAKHVFDGEQYCDKCWKEKTEE